MDDLTKQKAEAGAVHLGIEVPSVTMLGRSESDSLLEVSCELHEFCDPDDELVLAEDSDCSRARRAMTSANGVLFGRLKPALLLPEDVWNAKVTGTDGTDPTARGSAAESLPAEGASLTGDWRVAVVHEGVAGPAPSSQPARVTGAKASASGGSLKLSSVQALLCALCTKARLRLSIWHAHRMQ